MNQIYLATKVPSVNHYWKGSGRHRYISPEGRAFKQQVAWQAKRNNFQLLEGDVEVVIEWFKKGRQRGDLDNILKVIMDSLNGIGYQDDKQVKSITARLWEQTGNDGVEIRVLPIKWKHGQYAATIATNLGKGEVSRSNHTMVELKLQS